MNKTTIIKVINLINAGDTQEARNILTRELLKAEKQPQKAKLFENVKKFLKSNDKTRPVLQTVMHKDNKQFICNGFELYVFNNYIEELDTLPNTTDESKVMNYKTILDPYLKYYYEPLNENDIFVLENLDKYISFYKATEFDKHIYIPFNNGVYNAQFLKDFISIYHDLENVKKQPYDSEFVATNGDIESIILPLRLKEAETEHYINIFNEFKRMIDWSNEGK